MEAKGLVWWKGRGGAVGEVSAGGNQTGREGNEICAELGA